MTPEKVRKKVTFEFVHEQVVGYVDVGVFEVSHQFVNLDLLDGDRRKFKFLRSVERVSALPQGKQFQHTLEDHVESGVTKSSLVVF